ncbi:MAG: MBL fold metallo-hydrolase [Planctomycetes bacterium]|nr:MBL fold metallo-hydrolase [Planctomycetota bacterium]
MQTPRDARLRQHVACLAIVDPESGQRWLLDCTPDLPEQLHELHEIAPFESSSAVDGILLTHAHIGHYFGLMHLGREAMGAKGTPVYTMPRMRRFLEANDPWRELITSEHIKIRDLEDNEELPLNDRIRVRPFSVPHRAEFSETVGFQVDGPSRSVIYISDIDGWDRWDTRIEEVISAADVAYLDGTFFDDNEVPGRNMADIPHPTMTATLKRLSQLSVPDRRKVRFIHLNHTNPALDPNSEAAKTVTENGCCIAQFGERFEL